MGVFVIFVVLYCKKSSFLHAIIGKFDIYGMALMAYSQAIYGF